MALGGMRMTLWQVWLAGLGTATLMMVLVWVGSVRTQDASLVDRVWGLAFVVLNVLAQLGMSYQHQSGVARAAILIGAGLAIRSNPDGHSLLLGSNSTFTVNPAVYSAA